jgi:hypothetical protein
LLKQVSIASYCCVSQKIAAMTAKIVRNWFAKLGGKTLYVAPGSP